MYTIKEFWAKELSGIHRQQVEDRLPGWTINTAPNNSFVEANLELREGFDNLKAKIWFVAAPGAVGKSTLAKQISSETGAVYLDLSKADTVAGNYLAGGLVKSGLYNDWKASNTTILIDALDEARLRVTASSFDDFIDDLIEMSVDRNVPIVIFGRIGIVDDSWIIMSEKGINAPIFDISFF